METLTHETFSSSLLLHQSQHRGSVVPNQSTPTYSSLKNHYFYLFPHNCYNLYTNQDNSLLEQYQTNLPRFCIIKLRLKKSSNRNRISIIQKFNYSRIQILYNNNNNKMIKTKISFTRLRQEKLGNTGFPLFKFAPDYAFEISWHLLRIKISGRRGRALVLIRTFIVDFGLARILGGRFSPPLPAAPVRAKTG